MSNIIEFKAVKKSQESASTEENWELHDSILDFIEDNFPEGGMVLTVENGDVHVATALHSLEFAEEVLLAALEVIQGKGQP